MIESLGSARRLSNKAANNPVSRDRYDRPEITNKYQVREIVISQLGVPLTISPIAHGYRKLCGAILISAFVARLAIRKVAQVIPRI